MQNTSRYISLCAALSLAMPMGIQGNNSPSESSSFSPIQWGMLAMGCGYSVYRRLAQRHKARTIKRNTDTLLAGVRQQHADSQTTHQQQLVMSLRSLRGNS